MGSVCIWKAIWRSVDASPRECCLLPDQLAPTITVWLPETREGYRPWHAGGPASPLPDHASSCEVLGSLLMSAQRYSEAEISLEKPFS